MISSNRVLVVEDEAEIGLNYCEELAVRGFDAQEHVSTITEALTFADRFPVKGALLDIWLRQHKKAGVFIARALRFMQPVPHVYVTAHFDTETIEHANSTNPEFIGKKPAFDEAISKLERAIRRHAVPPISEQPTQLDPESTYEWGEKFDSEYEDAPELAGEKLIRELEKRSVHDPLFQELVIKSEYMQFTESQEEYLAPCLIGTILNLRKTCARGPEVVWSAMRTYASVASPNELDTLCLFLDMSTVVESRTAVDTLLVSLKCIRNRFEAIPPQATDCFGKIAKVVAATADAYFHKYVVPVGRNSTIAHCSLMALLFLGSTSAERVSKVAAAASPKWLKDQIALEIDSVLRESNRLEGTSDVGALFKNCQRILEQ